MKLSRKIAGSVVMVALCVGLIWFIPSTVSAQLLPGDIDDCDDCPSTVDVNGDLRASSADLLIVYRDIVYGPPDDSNNDVNENGTVDMDDYHIVRRCLGCSVCTSPFR